MGAGRYRSLSLLTKSLHRLVNEAGQTLPACIVQARRRLLKQTVAHCAKCSVGVVPTAHNLKAERMHIVLKSKINCGAMVDHP